MKYCILYSLPQLIQTYLSPDLNAALTTKIFDHLDGYKTYIVAGVTALSDGQSLLYKIGVSVVPWCSCTYMID